MSTPIPGPPRRRPRIPAAAVVVLLASAAAAGVWWWSRTAPAEVPPVPPDLQDAEVRQVIEAAREKVVAAPRSAAAWGELGLAFLANQYDREASRCFAEAARLDPDDVRWPYGQGYIALKRDPGRALPLLRAAAEGTTPGPDCRSVARLLLAETLLERGELDEAERLFTAERQSPVGRERAVLGLGLVALARGEPGKAEDLLETARSSPRSRKQATIRLAAVARDRDDLATASALGREADGLPGDAAWPDPMIDELVRLRAGRRAREKSITQLEGEQRFDQAATEYMRQLQQKPTVRAYCGAAVNFARIGQYDRALGLIRDSIRLDPDDSQGSYTLAAVTFTRGEEIEARSPGSAEARGWFRQAADAARRATELKPDHAQAYRIWGSALRHLGEPAAAVEPLRKGLACRPEQMALHLALAEALRDAGRTKEAEAQFETASRLDPGDPRPKEALNRLRGGK